MKKLAQLWLGLRIAKRILVFATITTITNSIVLFGDNVPGYCSNCTTRRVGEAARDLETDDEEDENENEAEIIHQVVVVNHLRVPNAQVAQSLFQDHKKFMFFFEGVAELFIQQRKDNPHEIRDFIRHLLSPVYDSPGVFLPSSCAPYYPPTAEF